ncbi:MAG: amino acid permease [Elusimicrobiales bacterium]|nr:amino acid permease [Elusimicrobiales bacterium]
MVPNQRYKQVFVLSTAMLSFISFWKAASVVLCDFGSSAYYAGGIAMKAFGPAFPWFILGVMLFAGLMLGVYTESCIMFVRGGVYVVVREAMGKVMAKFSVSALVFDYALTGPISSVTAGLYLGGLLANILPLLHINWHVPARAFAVIFALLVTAYFWRENIRGIEESADNNFKIIGFVAVVAVLLLGWSGVTLYHRGFTLPPFTPVVTHEALGWTVHFPWLKAVGLVGILMAFGHSILALSGLETLAQVYREIEDPKVKNLKKAVVSIFIFSVLFTGLLTFISALIIPPDLVAGKYAENLLSGLALELDGPYWARLGMQVLVVLSGTLMLVGAVNTSFVGANGVLNRVAEDGILHDWFRHLHKKYGTTHRLVNIIAVIQVLIIMISGGDIFLLGEAYAFGVLASMSFNTMSLVILRFKRREEEQEWMFPGNIKVNNVYFPVGLMLVLLVLLSATGMNLLTKKVATLGGLAFTAVFYAIFYVSEKMNEKKVRLYAPDDDNDEKLNLRREADINTVVPELTRARRILVPVRNPNNLVHLAAVLETADDDTTDIIVLSAKIAKGIQSGGETMSDEDKEVFSAVVLLAEKYGKTVKPIFVFSNDPFYSMAQVAQAAGADEIVMGVSGSTGAEIQLERLAMAWGMLKKPGEAGKPLLARVVWEGRQMTYQLS